MSFFQIIGKLWHLFGRPHQYQLFSPMYLRYIFLHVLAPGIHLYPFSQDFYHSTIITVLAFQFSPSSPFNPIFGFLVQQIIPIVINHSHCDQFFPSTYMNEHSSDFQLSTSPKCQIVHVASKSANLLQVIFQEVHPVWINFLIILNQ